MDTVGYEIGLCDPLYHAGILSDYGSTIRWIDVLRNAQFIDAFLKFTDNKADYYKDELRLIGAPSPLRKVIRRSSAVFLNTHPLTDSWRPSLRNVFDIGGIALHRPKPLPWDMKELMSQWKTVVLVSFGTVVPSSEMPKAWKSNLLSVKSFPEVLFLWKYEVDDEFTSQHTSNLYFSHFFPQNDLLHSSLISLFITHGGQNSILEAASAGVKIIVIPQFGDQFRNAQAVKERKLFK